MTPLSDSEAATVARFENAEPAPESWDGDDDLAIRLRKAIRLGLAQWAVVPLTHLGPIADTVLDAALPEIAALRAKADAADRVRALHRPWRDLPICQECTDEITVGWPCPTIDALDGPSC